MNFRIKFLFRIKIPEGSGFLVIIKKSNSLITKFIYINKKLLFFVVEINKYQRCVIDKLLKKSIEEKKNQPEKSE